MHFLHRLRIAAAEIQRVNQEVHVVRVVTGGIERIRLDPFQLDRGRRRKRRDRFGDLVALRVDVTRHVGRVRNVHDGSAVARVRVPRLLGRLAAFPRVNQIVMRAEPRIVLLDDFFEQPDRFHRVRARFLGDRVEAVVERETEHRLGFEIVRIRGDQLAKAGNVGGVAGVTVRCRAACRLRFDIQPLPLGHFVAQRHRLGDRFARANLRVDRGAVVRPHDRVARGVGCGRARSASRGVARAQQLEGGPVVAGGAQRDAPVRHRHVRVVLQRLQARAFRFDEPEGMNLRDALQQELPRLLGRRRHGKRLRRAHPRQQPGREQRLRSGRRRAHVGFASLLLLARGDGIGRKSERQQE